MDLESAICGRRSIRKFAEEEISTEAITKLIGMAIEALSPGNQQGWHFYVIKDTGKLQNMASLMGKELDNLIAGAGANPEPMHGPRRYTTWFQEAPVVIAVSTRLYRSRIDKTMLDAGYIDEEIDVLRCRTDLQTTGAAIQNLLLAAYAAGYGACWLTGPMLARHQLEDYLGIKPPESLAAWSPWAVRTIPRREPCANRWRNL